MLYFLLTAFLSFKCLAQFQVPDVSLVQTSVYDYAGILTAAEQSSLKQKLLNYADTTSTQIVVAIVPDLMGDSAEHIAPLWAQKWGVGQADKDNGIFMLVALRDRDMYIATGYGVQGRLTAGITGTIIRGYILPDFKRKQYYEGLDKGTDAIFTVLNGSFIEERSEWQMAPLWVKLVASLIGLFLVLGILTFIYFIIRALLGRDSGGSVVKSHGSKTIRGSSGRSGSRSGFGGGFGGGGFSGGGAGGS